MSNFDEYSVTTKLENQSECDLCSHKNVCTLKEDYKAQIVVIRKLGLESYIHVTARCEHYTSDSRIRPREFKGVTGFGTT